MKRSLRSWPWRVPVEQEVDEELAFHLEMRTRELIARGLDPAVARETALARAGDLARLRRSCVELGRKRDRDMRLTQWLEEFRDDVTFAVRQLKTRKLFTVVATLTLALGIGANAAVFGVLKSVLLDALPYADGQAPLLGAAFLLRTQGDPLGLMRPAERELAALDAGLALQLVTTLREAAGAGLAPRRLPVLLMTAFAVLALLVASVGVYAMFASLTAAREREFGVRMALGSKRRAIVGLVVRQGAVWMAAGLAGGALGVVLVVRLVRGLLYEVQPFDPITLGASVAILTACATLALLVPVRRATQVDPVIALRAQ